MAIVYTIRYYYNVVWVVYRAVTAEAEAEAFNADDHFAAI